MRSLDSGTASATAEVVTSPHWFVEMGFDTPIHLTTGATITWAGTTYTQADFSISDPTGNPTLSVFNEVAAFGVTVLTDGTSGRSLKIWQAYLSDVSSSLSGYTEPLLVFEGEMGEASIGDFVTIKSRRWAAQFSPRLYVDAPTFNHLPKVGDVINMPNQKVVLE